MYYARGGDSLNFSANGEGNAVLIKSAFPALTQADFQAELARLQNNNPRPDGSQRPLEKLCAGQTLLCKSMGVKVPDWNSHALTPGKFELLNDGYQPSDIIQTTRLGIHPNRDAHLPLRFIDDHFTKYCTKNPRGVRNWQNGNQYTILKP